MSFFNYFMQVSSLLEFHSVEIMSLIIFLVGFVTINKNFVSENDGKVKTVLECSQLKDLQQKESSQSLSDQSRQNYKYIEKLINNQQIQLAEEFIAKNVPAPTVYIYSLLMKAYAKNLNLQKAKTLLNFLENSQCKPNYVIYNTFLQCAIDSDQNLDIEQIFISTKDKDIVTYSLYINYLFKKNKVLDVMKIFSDLMRKNFDIDQKFFHCVMKGLLKQQENQLALKVYEVMKSKNFILNEYNVCVVLQLLTINQKFEEAEQVYYQFKNLKNKHVNSQVIKMYYHAKNYDKIIQIFETIGNKEEIIYQQVIKSLFNNKNYYKVGFQYLINCINMKIKLRQNTYEEAIQILFKIISENIQIYNFSRQQAQSYLVQIFDFTKKQNMTLNNEQIQDYGKNISSSIIQDQKTNITSKKVKFNIIN